MNFCMRRTGLEHHCAPLVICESCISVIMYHEFCPFFSMATWMIDEFGSEELREKFIPELASMEVKLIYHSALTNIYLVQQN